MSMLLKALEGVERDRKMRETATLDHPSPTVASAPLLETLEFDRDPPAVPPVSGKKSKPVPDVLVEEEPAYLKKSKGRDAGLWGAMAREEKREKNLEFGDGDRGGVNSGKAMTPLPSVVKPEEEGMIAELLLEMDEEVKWGQTKGDSPKGDALTASFGGEEELKVVKSDAGRVSEDDDSLPRHHGGSMISGFSKEVAFDASDRGQLDKGGMLGGLFGLDAADDVTVLHDFRPVAALVEDDDVAVPKGGGGASVQQSVPVVDVAVPKGGGGASVQQSVPVVDVTYPTSFYSQEGLKLAQLGRDNAQVSEKGVDGWDLPGELTHTVDFQPHFLKMASPKGDADGETHELNYGNQDTVGSANRDEFGTGPTSEVAPIAGSPSKARQIRDASRRGEGGSRKRMILRGGAYAAMLCVLAAGGIVYYWKDLTPQPFPRQPQMMAKQERPVETQRLSVAPANGSTPLMATQVIAQTQAEPIGPVVIPSLKPEPKAPTLPMVAAVESPRRESVANAKPRQVESSMGAVERRLKESVRKKLADEAMVQEQKRVAVDQAKVIEEEMANNSLIKNRVLSLRLAGMREAFDKGRIDEAGKGFKAALDQEGENKDALFGMAAVMIRRGNIREAEGYYLKLLELDPSDSVALAGLSGIRTDIDPLRRESVIKSILQHEPDAHHLYFALGGLYAAQQRWGDAQQAYFRALSGKSDNPDYAFNLAVSLDHMGQRGQALEFYRKAVVLASIQRVGFSVAQAEKRILALGMKAEEFPVAVAKARMNPLK